MPNFQNIEINPFSFNGIVIKNIISHRIYAKSQGEPLPPKISKKLMNIDGGTDLEPNNMQNKDILAQRITKALGSKSHGIEVSIANKSEDSFFQVAASMLGANDNEFIELSGRLAWCLHNAQQPTNAPGGILAIISGNVGNDQLPFIVTIKAEPQDGFSSDDDDEQVNLKYINELFLTTSQRFYKIGFLVQEVGEPKGSDGYNPSNYRAFLFDHLISSTEAQKAAVYFYSSFLGFNISSSNRKLTETFYLLTRNFINNLSLNMSDKLELHEALRSELRSKEALISTESFSSKHVPDDLKEKYQTHMQTHGFTEQSIIKNLDYIKNKLKRRKKFFFANGISVETPHDVDKSEIKFEYNKKSDATIVTIKGSFKKQE